MLNVNIFVKVKFDEYEFSISREGNLKRNLEKILIIYKIFQLN